ncbi:MAG: hypothetical protein KKD73_01305 [Proteobacteria bacterium]|nr:hypothetical protein [Pseudomonadota bacterium]MBU1641135.1 hypothetical protein [Pseudomonadota bacterium]
MMVFLQSTVYPLVLALAVIFSLSGCFAGKTNKSSLLSTEGGMPFVNGAKDAAFYQHETKKWQTMLEVTADPQKKAEAHLHLATLFLAQDNPRKDYHTGYVELTQATTIWPDLTSNLEITSWLELLNHLEDEEQRVTNDIAALESTVARIKDQNATQRQELVKLRETLDTLTRLELSVERKRRSLR